MLQVETNLKNKFGSIDLFAGGGGLTVGLKRAGFKVITAVEIEQHAFTTYKTNHPEVQIFRQDIRTIRGASLKNLFPGGKVDLIAGCPPCQGFSSLTRKQKAEDPRNTLVLEMARIIKEIQPLAVMMENVPGLCQRGKPLFNEFLNILTSLGYVIDWGVLQVADYGIPQNRRRLVLLAGKGFKIDLPKPTHSYKSKKGLLPWRELRDVISNMPEPVVLEEAMKAGGPQRFNWHVVSKLMPENVLRLKSIKPGQGRDAIPNILRPDCHKNIDKGFSNVYGRMRWDQPSVTITGGCTTLSKGRFGHPEKDRTISVREAALIQTFPHDYFFDTPHMRYVCDIIGNALPCDFAEIVSMQCINALKLHETSQ